MIHIQWWWSRSSDDLNLVWWCRLSDHLDLVMMIQIKWWSRYSDDDPDQKMNMTWIWQGLKDDPDDTEKKNYANKLCRENTFLVKRECWCICNFGMYSLVFLMDCNLMFIPGCVCDVFKSCHTLMFIPGSFYNVNKSCQVIVGNPPIDQGLKSSQFQGTRVIRIS